MEFGRPLLFHSYRLHKRGVGRRKQAKDRVVVHYRDLSSFTYHIFFSANLEKVILNRK